MLLRHGLGQTQPNGRRRPDASLSRRSITSVTVTPYGRSPSTRQPGPSRVNVNPSRPLPCAWLIVAERTQRAKDDVAGELGRLGDLYRPVDDRSVGLAAGRSGASNSAPTETAWSQPGVRTQRASAVLMPTSAARVATTVRSRTRPSRCRDSFGYSAASSRRTAARGLTLAVGDPAHRGRDELRRPARAGARGARRRPGSGARDSRRGGCSDWRPSGRPF